jgi:hypothetical protein
LPGSVPGKGWFRVKKAVQLVAVPGKTSFQLSAGAAGHMVGFEGSAFVTVQVPPGATPTKVKVGPPELISPHPKEPVETNTELIP